MKRRALTGYVCISANMVKSAPKYCCDIAHKWREQFFLLNSSLWTLFHEKMSREEDHKTLQEECKDDKVAFLRRRKIGRERRVHESAAERQERLKADLERVFAKLSQESREEREKRLKVLRDNNASRRAVETTEQREKRLGTQRKQAALKRASETGQERERRLRVMREVAAKKRATESSQEKELRLRARRVDEQRLSATARTGRKQSRLAEETKHERRPTIADGTSRRLSLKDTAANICTTADGQTLKIAVCITKSGPRRRWQPSIASRKTCATIIVSCKEAWPLSPSRQQIFTCSRCKRDRKPCRLYSAENDMDPGSVPAELQGLSEVEELLIARAFPTLSIYRKHGGQRGYKGHVLNLPQDIQGFLNSLPANVSDLPILVIRKQGAGEPLK